MDINGERVTRKEFWDFITGSSDIDRNGWTLTKAEGIKEDLCFCGEPCEINTLYRFAYDFYAKGDQPCLAAIGFRLTGEQNRDGDDLYELAMIDPSIEASWKHHVNRVRRNHLALIEEIIDEHKLTGQPYEIRFPVSEFHPSGRCYQLLLGQDQRHEVFRVYAGQGTEEMTLAEALWNLVDDADHHSGYIETLERWLPENEDYVVELGQDGAEQLYKEARETYLSLNRVLDRATYEALVEVIW
jgi:hypothetical protein